MTLEETFTEILEQAITDAYWEGAEDQEAGEAGEAAPFEDKQAVSALLQAVEDWLGDDEPLEATEDGMYADVHYGRNLLRAYLRGRLTIDDLEEALKESKRG